MNPILLAAALLISLTSGPAAAADIYIGIDRADSPRWALGLDTFFPKDPQRSADDEMGRKLREVLRSDLLFSRYFNLVDKGPRVEDRKDLDAWQALGAGFLLQAQTSHIKEEVTLTVTVRDLGSGDKVLSRFYRQNDSYWRSLAHRLADDVLRQLTGKQGIARTQIAFVNDSSGAKELCLMDYDGARYKPVTANGSINIMPRWAPNGRSLAFTSYKDGNPDIFQLDLSRNLVSPLSDRQGLNMAGGFSPDGRTLAATLTHGRSPKVYFLGVRDGNPTRITSSDGVESSPTYSPDGEQIAFVTDRSGNPQIYTSEIATGRSRKLSRLNWCDSPAWSPTGEWIAFAGRANPKDAFDIFLSDITGERIVQLTHGEGSNEDPTWSPDGRFIVFSTDRDKRRRIYIMDRDGSAPHPLGDLPGNSFTPSWGPAQK